MNANANACLPRPNVILVMTDDQGYGDLGCTGNPWIRTPAIDAFCGQAVRLTDFHVSPLCTPTRGALMTGRRPIRNGAWATTWGRSMLRRDETTMADIFRAGGYRTGMFGKWHLGDNYPYRPQDRGFEHVVAHKGGGVGQTPDFWGNNYFDDTYFHNGRPVSHEGYCTDVWFDEAMAWIEQAQEAPFFCYIATNAPHAPYRVADRYRQLYADNAEIPEPAFYGMITNIDENFARLEQFLARQHLADNTILIFMTDNGSSGGWCGDPPRGYNAGMRGAKGSYYDGGHRVPLFIRWPGGELGGGRDIGDMCLHVDVLPTLVELCGLSAPRDVALDGVSVAPLLRGQIDALPDRHAFLQYRQSVLLPEKWTNAVMTGRWRLIGGRELYDIQADGGQQHDVADKNPQVVAELRAAHEQWWEQVRPQMDAPCPITLGSDAENPTCLCAFDVLGDVAWHQGHILQAQRCSGLWAVDVERPGRYRISLRRWPEELPLAIDAAADDDHCRRSAYQSCEHATVIRVRQATLTLFGADRALEVSPGQSEAVFELDVTETGQTMLEAWFVDDGDRRGAYYVRVERLGV